MDIKDGDIIDLIVDGIEWKPCLVIEDKKRRFFAIRLFHSPKEIIDITELKNKKRTKKGKTVKCFSKKRRLML